MSENVTHHKRSYRRTAVGVFLLGAFWVVGAALVGAPKHGELGGAIGVILSLLVIAQRPNFGFILLDQIRSEEHEARGLQQMPSEEPTIVLSQEELTRRSLAIEAIFRSGNRIERENVRWLALTTAIATFFWGFGEILANLIYSVGN